MNYFYLPTLVMISPVVFTERHYADPCISYRRSRVIRQSVCEINSILILCLHVLNMVISLLYLPVCGSVLGSAFLSTQ